MPDPNPTISPEAAILDRVVALIPTEDRWCQGQMQDGEKRCLVQALDDAEANDMFYQIASVLIEEAGMDPATYNDTHTHAEVLGLIARVRETVA